MKKIPTLFQRNYETDRLVRDEVVPGCEWVLAGEGRATEKIDGTACLIDINQRFLKRYELKNGKPVPAGFERAQIEADPITGDLPGWIPIKGGPEDKWHREAMVNFDDNLVNATVPATYELIGPKVQGNPYRLASHILVRHGDRFLPDVPRDFEGLQDYLREHEIEGIVWHHPDGRMAKLKRSDFGFAWGSKKAK